MVVKKDNEGNITGLCSTIQDISDRKKNEIALHESNRLLDLKILYIDDNDSIRKMIYEMLRTYNHNIDIKSSGISGLEKFRKELNAGHPFDIVITDLGMPDMDGKTLARNLKNISPHIPIILLTGWGSLIDEENQNVDYILKKPVTIEELNKALRKVYK